jgi:CotS family spore coat protein
VGRKNICAKTIAEAVMMLSFEKQIEAAYDVNIKEMFSVRDVHQLITRERRAFCVKGHDIPESEIHFIARVFAHLSKSGYRYSPVITPTKSKALWVTRGHTHYMLTNWITGKSPDFKDRTAFKKAIETLAAFHHHAKGFAHKDVPARRNRYSLLPNTIRSYRTSLSRYGRIGSLSAFTSLFDAALHYLNQPVSMTAIKQEKSAGAFVHGDYNYPNLVADADGFYHLIDFENTSLHVRMTDLAHILHRNMAWDGPEIVRWVEKYDRVRPLSREDRYLLYALLHVPYPLVRAIRRNKSSHKITELIPTAKAIDQYVRYLRELL